MKKRKSVTTKNTKQKTKKKKSSIVTPLAEYYIREIPNDINKIYDMVEDDNLSYNEIDTLLDAIFIADLQLNLGAKEHLINARRNFCIKQMVIGYKYDKDNFLEQVVELIGDHLELLDGLKEHILPEDYEHLDMLIKTKRYGI